MILAIDTKRCSKCKGIKRFTDFHKQTARKDGYQLFCKGCMREANRGYYHRNIEKETRRHFRFNYGHCTNYENVMEQYHAIDKCECCHKPFGDTKNSGKCIDHYGDLIRGLICGFCNTGIGMLGDTPIGVEKAARYLQDRHEHTSH